jgi:hypothetical protein
MAVPLEIDSLALEGDTLGREAQALFQAGLARESYGTACAHNAMPPGCCGCAQRPDHLARASRVSGGRGDIAVGRDLAARDLADHFQNVAEHLRVILRWTRMLPGRKDFTDVVLPSKGFPALFEGDDAEGGSPILCVSLAQEGAR